ncbi:MAG: hypothetical protein U0796_15075 [Gemmatales bacterium]
MPAITVIVESVVAQTLEQHRQTLSPDAFREMLRNLADRFGQEAYEADHSSFNFSCTCVLCLAGEQPAF